MSHPRQVNCSTCGGENADHLTFCQVCGQRLRPRVAPPTPAIGLSPPDTAAASVSHAAPHAGGPCEMCGTENPSHVRYCLSCGTATGGGHAPATPHPPAPVHPIAPTPMIAIGPSRGTPALVRVCGRCHGTCEATAAFCKFCGASMGDIPAGRGEMRTLTPAPNPIAVAADLAPVPAPAPVAPTPAPAPIAPVRAAPSPVLSPAPPAPVQAAPVAYAAPAAAPAPQVRPVAAPQAAPAHEPPPRAVSAAAPTRRPEPTCKLVVVTRDGQPGTEYPFTDQIDIGRREGLVIVPEDRYLSPRHARITWAGGRCHLYDLQSANGVYVRLSPRITLRGYNRVAHDRFAATVLDESQEGTLPDETERNPGAPSARVRERETEFHGGAFLEDQDLILVGQQVLRFEIVKEGAALMGPAYQHDTLLFGTPSSRRFARLCQRGVEGTTLDVHHLRKLETVMGREVGDLLFADDPFLSRTHAAVRVEEGPTTRFSVVDLGSSNGTFLRVSEAVEVFDGDQFRVGQQLFRIELPGGS